jgi:2-polyprenyl-6-methoxyphenol hydroxylase-like FAD-dependent oxidoreductase
MDRDGAGGDTKTQVLVSGAGPTGLLLAVELQRRGVDHLLVDALDAPQGWDRATVIHARSLEIFEALGLNDRLLSEGVETRGARFYSDGQALGELDLGLADCAYRFDLGLSEEVTERVLTDHLESLGGSVTRSTRLLRFAPASDGVTATLERNGTSFEVEADWLVGCDGLHSTIRETCGIGFPGSEIPAPWAVFDATIARWDRELDVAVAFLDQPPVTMTPLPGRRWRVYLRPASDDSDLVAEATGVLHRYAPKARFFEIENPARFHCHSRVAERYRSGRALLAGDAAHVCTPAEGHGMNTGLQDAFNLGWKLALVCREAAGEHLLDSYGVERRPVAEQVVASGADVEAGRALSDPVARMRRDAAIRLDFSDPTSSRHDAAAAAEIDRSYAGSPIVAGTAAPGIAAGNLLPSTVEVDHPAAGRSPLHRFTHRAGHTLLVIGGPAADPGAVEELAAGPQATHAGSEIVEAAFGFSAQSGGTGVGRIDAKVAERLGIAGLTVLAIRPDRYVGLRHDGGDARAVERYVESLTR